MREGATIKMAKYSRYDPRNKNKGKHKVRAMEKDLRIKKSTTKSSKLKLKSYQAENLANIMIKEDF
jgi:hypothetical protein